MRRLNITHINLRLVRFRLAFIIIILGCLWAAFAKLIVSPIIQGAYDSSHASLLKSLILGLGQHPDEYYLKMVDKLAGAGLLGSLGFCLVALVLSSPAFFRRFVDEATPGSLGAIRVLTCAVLLANTLWENVASTTLLPIEMRQPKGLMKLFYILPINFESFVQSSIALEIFKWSTAIILLLGMIGWRTRIMIPLGAFCYFLFGGILRQYTHFFHLGVVPLYVLTVLSFTPCGDGWSIDQLRKVWQGKEVPNASYSAAVYGWSRYACWVVVALGYLLAGISKLRNGGLFWWNATNLKSIVLADTLNPMHFDWGLGLHLTSAPDILFTMLGLTALLGELMFVCVLFSRLARWILPTVIIMMHSGIWLLQNVFFFDLILLQFMFFDFTKIRNVIRNKILPRLGPIEILYDGDCPLCSRTVRLLKRLDLLGLLNYLDFRLLDLTEYNRTHRLNLVLHDLEKEMHVIFRGQAYKGFYGYRIISLSLPLFWLITPALFVPGVSSLGVLLYRYAAHNRFRFLSCASDCVLEPLPKSMTPISSATKPALHGVHYPIAISVLITVILIVGLYRVEVYPLTAFQMYSTSDTSGVITYYKVLAHHESGAVVRAYLEDGISAMADTRYRSIIRRCFDPEKRGICEKYLMAAGNAYNHTHTGDDVTRYELQKWRWDFRSTPSDPEHGELTDRYILTLK